MLKFSIIVPSYNQGHFIAETFESLIAQDYENLEIIVMDGGSTDNTVEVIKKYETHLSYWISEKDKGQSHAINKGFSRATGDIVTWLNSDDQFYPGVLKKANEHFQKNPDAALIHGGATLFGEHMFPIEKFAPTEDIYYRYLSYIPFPQPGSFFRKAIFKSPLVEEHFHYGMDYDLLVRIALNHKILPVDTLFAKYRIHTESKTNDHLLFCKDWQKIFSKVLRTIKASNKHITLLQSLDFYTAGPDTYTCSKSYSTKEITLITCHFLLIQFHYYYQALDLNTSKKISSVIKELDVHFYQKHGLQKEAIKTHLLGKKGITIMRKLFKK